MAATAAPAARPLGVGTRFDVAEPGAWAGMDATQRARIVAIHVALLAAALVFLFPFLWSALTSLKSQQEAVSLTLLPREWTIEGYRTAFGAFPFAAYFRHSVLLAVAVTISNVGLCALGGYAFARLRFPGSNVLFAVVLGAMMIPDQVRMVPVFKLLATLGLIDTYTGVWIVQAVTPMGLFLMRQHFRTLPRELEESARLDGAGHFTTFRVVMLPLSGPALATLAILTFQASWNEFFWPLLVLQDPAMHTLPLGLALFTSAYETQWPPLMAATVVATLPVLLVYVFAQRYFVSGATDGAVKG